MQKITGTVTIKHSNGGYELKIKPYPIIARGRNNCPWLHEAIRDGIGQIENREIVRLETCAVVILDTYPDPEMTGAVDPDNLDIKTILDTTKGVLFTDDYACVSLHVTGVVGDERCTIVQILPPEKVLFVIK